MTIKDLLSYPPINNNTILKCYNGKGSITKLLFEGKLSDPIFMSKYQNTYVAATGKYDKNKNTYEVYVDPDIIID